MEDGVGRVMADSVDVSFWFPRTWVRSGVSMMSDYNLEQRMMSVMLRNTRGNELPKFFLVSKRDMAAFLDRHAEELEKWTGGMPYFRGLRLFESELAEDMKPLVVME